MQHAQYNFIPWVALAALVCALNPAFAGTIAHPTPPDPLLDGMPGPCAKLATGADYAAGTDATGHRVIPADVGTQAVPLPDEIMRPVGGAPAAQAGRTGRGAQNPVTAAGQGAYVALNGQKLKSLLNPPRCGK